jgi:hypothetical protein
LRTRAQQSARETEALEAVLGSGDRAWLDFEIDAAGNELPLAKDPTPALCDCLSFRDSPDSEPFGGVVAHVENVHVGLVNTVADIGSVGCNPTEVNDIAVQYNSFCRFIGGGRFCVLGPVGSGVTGSVAIRRGVAEAGQQLVCHVHLDSAYFANRSWAGWGATTSVGDEQGNTSGSSDRDEPDNEESPTVTSDYRALT